MYSRRHFVSSATLLASHFAFAGDAGLPSTPWPRSSGQVFTAAEWATLDAVTARILPSDQGPGAKEAAVVAFIDLQLSGSAPLSFLRQPLKITMGLFDSWANARHGKAFAELAPVQQDEGLGRLAHGLLPVKDFPQKQLFRLLHSLTLEGFLADPLHGGNRERVGWTSIRFGVSAHGNHGP